MAQQTIVLTAGTSWTAPSDCSLIDTLEIWGGNASGAGPRTTTGQRGGGGGSGAYARWLNISTTPGTAYTIAIGAGGPRRAGGTGTAGGTSTITIGGTTYTVPGGAGGLSGTGGAGGAGGAGGPTASVAPAATASFKGGDGAAGTIGGAAGGGGGSPGSTGAGGNASAGTGGAAGTGSPAGTVGGNGGTAGAQDGLDGASPDGLGAPGSAGGGGAWDGTYLEHSGAGGGGQIIIKYTPAAATGTRVAQLVGFDVAAGDWAAGNALIGPGDTHRLFYNTSNRLLPATFDADGTPANVTVITSYKVQNTNVAAYIASIPNNRSVIMIYHHEPEGDYPSGSTFVSEFKKQSDLIRAAQAARGDLGVNIRVGMCSAGFPYRSGGPADVLAGNYLTGLGSVSGVSGKPYADMFTRDVYQGTAGIGGFDWPSNGLANYVQFQNWLKLVTNPAVVGVVRPLGITEYGITLGTGITTAVRNTRIALDRDYLQAAFTPGGASAVSPYPMQMWCYWHQCIDVNCTTLSGAAEIATWQAIEGQQTGPPAGVSMIATPTWGWAPNLALQGATPVPGPTPGPPIVFPPGRDWHLVIGPASGGYATEIGKITGQRFTWRLTDAHDAAFTVNALVGYDSGIAPLATDLHIIRGGGELFRGRIMPASDAFDAVSHLVTFGAQSYRFLLDHRILYSDSRLKYADIDVGSIVWALLADTQSQPGGDLGIQQGVGFPFGTVGTKICQPGDYIGETIDSLAYVDTTTPGAGGFDWDISARDAFSLTVDLWQGARGSDQGIWLQRGDDITSSAWARTVDPSGFATATRTTGGGTTPPTPVEIDDANVATRPEGRWDEVFQCDENDPTRLSARAILQLGSAQALLPSYTIPLRPGAWGGPDHIWIGDTVNVRPNSGRLTATETLRVLEIDVTLTSDAEQVVLIVGAPRPDLRRKFARLVRELRSARKKRLTGQFVIPGHH